MMARILSAACFAGLLAIAGAAPEPELPPPPTAEAPAALTPGTPLIGVVVGDRLNVRANPGVRYEVVTQLARDTRVTVRKVDGDWLGIDAPVSAQAWVAAKYLSDGQVNANNVPLYSGPGIYFSSYGNLARGQALKVVRTEDAWSQVVPPAGILAWVHHEYIQLPQAPKPPAEPPTPRPMATPLDKVPERLSKTPAGTHVLAPPEPGTGASLTPMGKPQAVEQVGYIIPLAKDQTPWEFAIALKVSDTYYPIAFLDPAYPDLAKLQWHLVTLKGQLQWLIGYPRPRIVIESLLPVETETPPAKDAAP